MKEKKCLTTTCNRNGDYAHGLCKRCYQRIDKRIKWNQFQDWKDVIKSGIQKAAIHPAFYYDRMENMDYYNNSQKSGCCIKEFDKQIEHCIQKPVYEEPDHLYTEEEIAKLKAIYDEEEKLQEEKLKQRRLTQQKENV
jgi:hypothetical protein